MRCVTKGESAPFLALGNWLGEKDVLTNARSRPKS